MRAGEEEDSDDDKCRMLNEIQARDVDFACRHCPTSFLTLVALERHEKRCTRQAQEEIDLNDASEHASSTMSPGPSSGVKTKRRSSDKPPAPPTPERPLSEKKPRLRRKTLPDSSKIVPGTSSTKISLSGGFKELRRARKSPSSQPEAVVIFSKPNLKFPITCPRCSARCLSADILAAHEASERTFTCKGCGRELCTKAARYRHRKFACHRSAQPSAADEGQPHAAPDKARRLGKPPPPELPPAPEKPSALPVSEEPELPDTSGAWAGEDEPELVFLGPTAPLLHIASSSDSSFDSFLPDYA